jgi:hypothetical protein
MGPGLRPGYSGARMRGEEAVAVRITCPKCKQTQDVDDKTATCPNCRTVLRRCADCDKYDVRLSFCQALNRPIDAGEANYPTYSSDSTYCREYTPANVPA